jgi:hypothetical protein
LQRAKWHIDISLEQDKNNLEALRLKDQIEEGLSLGNAAWLSPPWTSAPGADAPPSQPHDAPPPMDQPAPEGDVERVPQASGPRWPGGRFWRRDNAVTGPVFGTQAAPGRVVIRGQDPSP